MNRRGLPVALFISVSLVTAGTGCSSLCSLLESSTAGAEPQSGDWRGIASYPSSGGRDMTWHLTFTVTGDGTRVTEATVIRYLGELTGDTQAVWMRSLQSADVERGSFSLSFTEWRGYSTHTHVFEGTFTSTSEAAGTLTTGGETHEWTASLVEP